MALPTKIVLIDDFGLRFSHRRVLVMGGAVTSKSNTQMSVFKGIEPQNMPCLLEAWKSKNSQESDGYWGKGH